jgi:uncharacterized protein (TIGR03083 family)
MSAPRPGAGAASGEQAIAPPPDLRAQVLEASRRGRTPGRPAPDVPDISPVDAFSRRGHAFYTTLSGLDDGQWHRPALRDLDVQGLVGHLTGVEEDMQRGLDGDPEVARAEHVASTQPAALRQAGRPPAQTHAEYGQAARQTLARVRDAGDFDAIATVYGLPLPLGVWLVVRAFELWTHENDIRRAAGLPASIPDPATLRLMTDLVAGVLPLATAGAGLDQAISLRLVLTGPGGGAWDVPVGGPAPDAAPMRIVTNAVGFCRLAANRCAPADLDLHLTGDPEQAALVLAAATTLGLD